MSTFGDRFKKLRLSKDLTQEQLAEEFNEKYRYSFTKATISQYENNKRTPEMNVIRNFVDYFKTSLDYLLCNDSYILKEMSGRYSTGDNSDHIDLENIIIMINSMALNGKIKVNEAQTQILNNCLEISLELIKKTAL